MKDINVLIIDDSAIVRKVLTNELSRKDGINVVGAAQDPYVAREQIVRLKPDVLTLDVEMPRMDGITFLKKVMQHKPMPVIIVSSLTKRGSALALEAFASGAVDVVSKPDASYSVGDMSHDLAEKIRVAAFAKVTRRIPPADSSGLASLNSKALAVTTNKIIAIGASTGGTEAIKRVLTRFPENTPGILVVQHMPAKFTTSFAERLHELSRITVREARDGDSVTSGSALLAPGDFHLKLNRSGARYYVQVGKGPLVHHQRPAADVLFKSVAKYAGANALGIILTGMGSDGAEGLLAMKEAGSYNIAQDESSCVVYGMPKEAVKAGAVDISLDIEKIAAMAIEKIVKPS